VETRVVFYARPWSAAVFMAVEDAWRADGHAVHASYVANHLAAAEMVRASGREATFLPEAIGRIPVDDPIEALVEIEARYSGLLPLMRYLMAERMFRGRATSWQLDLLARYALFFDRLYRAERWHAVVGEGPDTMANWLAFDMAHQEGIVPVGLVPSTLPPGRILTLRNHREIPGAREHFERLRRTGLTDEEEASAIALQEVVLGEGTKVDFMPPPRGRFELLQRVTIGGAVRRQLAFARQQQRERRAGNWFVDPNPVVQWARQPALRLRARAADARFLNQGAPGRPFAFYPLNYEPEAVLLVHSSYFENQLEVVRNVARSLPVGWELAVKEHFAMRGDRKLSFYRALQAIPNVRMLPFSSPTNRLIQQAEVVIVNVSTCGLEASLIGKPVVMFGDYPWDYAPTVRKVPALAQLPATIREAAETDLGPSHADVLAFAASWDAALPPGRYYSNRGYNWLEPANVERIAGALWTAASGASPAAGQNARLATEGV
jgi:hypothetical protein